MSHVVPCPSCRHPLRLPNDLLGQAVRCPSCQTIFQAAAPPSPAAPSLSLDDIPPAPAPSSGRGTWGAVEIESSGGGSLPPPPTPVPEPRRPRLYADDDAKDEERDRRPRSLSRSRKEPHRGTLVLTLGILSLVLSGCAPVGLTLGILAWVFGQGDLGKIRRREMEAEGEGQTTGGMVCGIIGVVLSVIVGGLTMIWFMRWTEEINRPSRPPWNAPPNRKQGF